MGNLCSHYRITPSFISTRKPLACAWPCFDCRESLPSNLVSLWLRDTSFSSSQAVHAAQSRLIQRSRALTAPIDIRCRPCRAQILFYSLRPAYWLTPTGASTFFQSSSSGSFKFLCPHSCENILQAAPLLLYSILSINPEL